MRKAAVLLVLALAHCASGPTTGVDEKVNLFPLVRYETRDAPAGHTLDVLWPIYQHKTEDERATSHLVPLWWSSEQERSSFLNVLVLFWRTIEPSPRSGDDVEWHLFPFLHFRGGGDVTNAHVWPFYGRETAGSGSSQAVTHSVLWPLNEFWFHSNGMYRWHVLGVGDVFSLARGTSSLSEINGDTKTRHRPTILHGEYDVVSAFDNAFSLWHSSRNDAVGEDGPPTHAEKSLLNVFGIVKLFDHEQSEDGTYRSRILGFFDEPWFALATRHGRTATESDPGEAHAQLFPLWRSSVRADGSTSRWFGTFLFGRETDPAAGKTGTHVLWPLIASETDGAGADPGWHFRFLPFAWFTHRAGADLTVLPFWYRFEDPIESQYFLYPFVGKNEMKDGSRTKSFVVPPLYIHTTESARALDRTQVLWPLTNFETHADGWARRVFPLFAASRDLKRQHLNLLGVYDREHSEVGDDWLLWPLWNEANGIGEGARTSMLPLLDLRHVFSPKLDGTETAFLWPLASSTQNGDSSCAWFFPFYFQFDNGTNKSWRHFWPLFGTNTEGDYVEHSTLFPLFRIGSNPDGTHTESRFLWELAGSDNVGEYHHHWFFWLWHDTQEESGSTERNVLWPLFHSEAEKNGTTFWHSLGYLLRSERSNTDDGKLVSEDFHFGGFLFHSHREPTRYSASVPFLYRFTREGDESTLRLFYLIPIRW